MIAEARRLYAHEELRLYLANTVYALDSTIVDLCMTMFPWARYKSAQHALKLHTLLDLRGSISHIYSRYRGAGVTMSISWTHSRPRPARSTLMDRAYLDFERLYRWTLQGAFFVTRARKNFRFTRLLSHPVDKTTGVQCDKTSRWCSS